MKPIKEINDSFNKFKLYFFLNIAILCKSLWKKWENMIIKTNQIISKLFYMNFQKGLKLILCKAYAFSRIVWHCYLCFSVKVGLFTILVITSSAWCKSFC
jgi:hypothetical protein